MALIVPSIYALTKDGASLAHADPGGAYSSGARPSGVRAGSERGLSCGRHGWGTGIGKLSTLAIFYELTPFRSLYLFWLPMALLLALSISHSSYLVLAPIELVWRHRHLGADLLLPWRVRAFTSTAFIGASSPDHRHVE